MTEIRRWDNNELIIEGEGSINELVAACAKLGNKSLEFADLHSANLSLADLSSANLRSANLSSANLRSANLSSAHMPLCSKWQLAYSLSYGVITIHIGCKSKTIPEWDALFAEIHEDYDLALQHFTRDELGSVDEAKRIRAHYLAYKAYIEAMEGKP